jgi:hypothetical protein
MKKTIRDVGLDVHQKTIAIAVAESGSAPARLPATLPNERVALTKCLERLGPAESLRVCDEAATGVRRWNDGRGAGPSARRTVDAGFDGTGGGGGRCVR